MRSADSPSIIEFIPKPDLALLLLLALQLPNMISLISYLGNIF